MSNVRLLSAAFASGLLILTASVSFAVDNDLDTFDSSIDCNDNDASIHPGAAEVVGDGIDEDCNGTELCYRDIDNDDFRTSLTVNSIDLDCTDAGEALPSDPPGDCNDSNASINPGATEVVDDGIDEDCNGTELCYRDIDNDDFRTNLTVNSIDLDCTDAGEGRATDPPTDCDDSDPGVNPAALEVCDGVAVDEDCDGGSDCDDSDCSSEPLCLGPVEVFDHLECFKIKSTEKLKGAVDLDPGTNPPFALAPGCIITKAKKYCVPVMKTVNEIETTLTPNPAFVGQELTDDRICYKVKCPDAAVGTITVEDQFGVRDFEKFKAMEICTPAQQVP